MLVTRQPSIMTMEKFLVLLVASLLQVKFTLVGQFSAGEILALLVTPFFFLRRAWVLNLPQVRWVFTLGTVWLAGQIISDFYNGSEQALYLRGWANIGMIMLMFAFFLSMFANSFEAIRWYLAGAVVAGVYGVLTASERYSFRGYGADDEFWDLNVAPWGEPLLLLLALFAWRRTLLVVCMFIAYGFSAIALGARSHGMVFILTSGLLMYGWWSSRTGYQMGKRQVLQIATVATLVFAVLFVIYVTLGLQGALGKKTYAQIASLNNPYNPINVIAMGRPELQVSLIAIKDRPILGHGSWAYDPRYDYVYEETLGNLIGQEVRMRRDPLERGIIPAHSMLFQAWIFGGLAGGLFWLAIITMMGQLFAFFAQRPHMTFWLLVMFTAVTFSWNVLFSPFGWARFSWPALMAFVVLYRTAAQNQEVGLQGSYQRAHESQPPMR